MTRPEEFAWGCKMCKSGAGISLQAQRGSAFLLQPRLLRCHHLLPQHQRSRQLSRTVGLQVWWMTATSRRASSLTEKQVSPHFRYSTIPPLSYFPSPFSDKSEHFLELKSDIYLLSTEWQPTSSALSTMKNSPLTTVLTWLWKIMRKSDTDIFKPRIGFNQHFNVLKDMLPNFLAFGSISVKLLEFSVILQCSLSPVSPPTWKKLRHSSYLWRL